MLTNLIGSASFDWGAKAASIALSGKSVVTLTKIKCDFSVMPYDRPSRFLFRSCSVGVDFFSFSPGRAGAELRRMIEEPAFTVSAPLPLAVSVKSLPLPDRLISAGPPSELSETISDPVRVPPATGANLILIVQFAAGAKFPVQSLVCEKSPVALIPEITMFAFPLLVSVTACAVLVEPTCCAVKFNDVADNVFAGAPAFPLSDSVCWNRPRLLRKSFTIGV